MQSGRVLRRKKTNLATALAGSFIMNAPGTYPVPYGAVGVMVGGRGPSGNPTTGGNVLQASTNNPAVYDPGGNYASGGNVLVQGNYVPAYYDAGGNYLSGGNVKANGNYVPASYTPGNYLSGGNVASNGYPVPAQYFPGNYLDGGNYLSGGDALYNPSWFSGSSFTAWQSNEYGEWAYSDSDHPWYAQRAPRYRSGTYYLADGGAGNYAIWYNVEEEYPGNVYFTPTYYNPTYYNPPTYVGAYYQPATYNPTNYNPPTYVAAYTNPTTYNPTFYNPAVYNPAYSNPTYYNPTNYNTASYTPSTANPTYYNPTVSGNPSNPTNIGGVTLPGAPKDALAPVVSPSLSPQLNYQTSGISVTVPPGGYVVLTPIGG